MLSLIFEQKGDCREVTISQSKFFADGVSQGEALFCVTLLLFSRVKFSVPAKELMQPYRKRQRKFSSTKKNDLLMEIAFININRSKVGEIKAGDVNQWDSHPVQGERGVAILCCFMMYRQRISRFEQQPFGFSTS